ncbi:hypothetical protein ESA94_20480 [Lacibacter luteus]|uniref:Uncharacterized protein n=1 Tax=Lacibacter luteus TaxID=2508719 RepID=A0A4Q1CDA9_9BACT|nr:hypothetical protein [Lacibacter luteus]RXK57578.1 hypothetical protein ESA94_20480 [Lacibacter luteus]
MAYYQAYNVDFKKLGLQTMYEHWRKAKHNGWIKAVLQPLVTLYSLFVIYRNTQRYKLQITPQVCFLEKALNDKYDVELRRIYIDEPPEKQAIPLYRKTEAKKQVLYRKSEATELVLYRKNETSVFSVDFLIVIPVSIAIDMPELRAYVDSYKLVTKTYTVQFI